MRLFIIGIQEENLNFLMQQMKDIFNQNVTIVGTTLKDLTQGTIRNSNVVLLSSLEIKKIVKPFLPETCQVIVAKRTVNIVRLKELMTIDDYSTFVVVNDNPDSTRETVEELKNILPNHNFIPYSGEEYVTGSFDYMVTPGESNLVPQTPNKVLDIGPRVISIETVVDLQNIFQLDIAYTLLMQHYIKAMVSATSNQMKVPREEVYDENKNRNFDSVSYNSSVMASTLKIAGEMAKTSNTIHITGEPGAGKQMMAEMIHNESDNQRYPFYIYNCLDKDESMIDEALFGKKEKGGSVLNAKKHGTIYIKNIEGLPYLMQNKLANFLDSDNHKRKIRVITSSFEDSFTLYSGGTLSQRLYSHLSSYTLNMPSIAERKEDIPILIDAFKHHLNKENMRFSEEALDSFYHYDWPGNVRELYNLISYCACLNQDFIGIHDLPIFFKGKQSNSDNGAVNKLTEDTKEIVKKIEQHGFLAESIEMLKIYQQGKAENISYGRGKIRQLLEAGGIRMSDQQLRLRIDVLNELGLLNVRVGRAGTTISTKGEKFLQDEDESLRNEI